MVTLSPALHPQIAALLQQKDALFDLSRTHEGPTHVVVPEIMRENAVPFFSVFKRKNIHGVVSYAHKASRSPSLVRYSQSIPLHIDVASKNELRSAIQAGYTGSQISCTGPKSDLFLQLALETGCLIAIDSVTELQRAREILAETQTARILVRLHDLSSTDRQLTLKKSRFGIAKKQLPDVYAILREDNRIALEGFHHHHDGYDAIAKAEFLKDMLHVVEDAHRQGFRPTILDIGGSFRAPVLEHPSRWEEYVDQLCEKVRRGQSTDIWGNDTYGLQLSESGKLTGREKLLSFSTIDTPEQFLEAVLSSEFAANQSLADAIGDNLFTLMVEPGYALLYNAGISIFTVTEVKMTEDGTRFLVLNGNMFHISSRMFEYIADPIHIPIHPTRQGNTDAYLVGNLCREDDFLMRRKVHFPQEVATGDLLVFANTAAYSSDFEETQSIQQAPGKRYIATLRGNHWNICTEEEFITIEG